MQSYSVDTKLGTMYIHPNGVDSITLMTCPIVRGIQYEVKLRVDKNNIKNVWHVNYNFVQIKRPHNKEVSDTTQHLIVNTSQAALDTWLVTHADACEETSLARLTREVQATRDALNAMRVSLKAKEQLLESQIEELGKLCGKAAFPH